jgi:hypothetical protein
VGNFSNCGTSWPGAEGASNQLCRREPCTGGETESVGPVVSARRRASSQLCTEIRLRVGPVGRDRRSESSQLCHGTEGVGEFSQLCRYGLGEFPQVVLRKQLCHPEPWGQLSCRRGERSSQLCWEDAAWDQLAGDSDLVRISVAVSSQLA